MVVPPAASLPDAEPPQSDFELTDRFGRVHRSLRLSVTDRCNIRCTYCMPEFAEFPPPRGTPLLRRDRTVRKSGDAARIRKVRVTGGEPLVRHDLPILIEKLATIPDLDEIALTTNGVLLHQHASSLKNAGLQRINVSLDTLRPEVFEQITRRKGLEATLQGIATAQQVGFTNIRLNAVPLRNVNEADHFAAGPVRAGATTSPAIYRIYAARRRSELAT